MTEHIVSFDPKFTGMGGGTICQLSWNTLKPALEKAFALKPNEKLLGLKVRQDGIDAYFEYVKLPLPVPKRVRNGISRASSSVYAGLTATKVPTKKPAKKKEIV